MAVKQGLVIERGEVGFNTGPLSLHKFSLQRWLWFKIKNEAVISGLNSVFLARS
jgi:hypothetical protein